MFGFLGFRVEMVEGEGCGGLGLSGFEGVWGCWV